jgi:hypothetical protein
MRCEVLNIEFSKGNAFFGYYWLFESCFVERDARALEPTISYIIGRRRVAIIMNYSGTLRIPLIKNLRLPAIWVT